MSAPDVAPPRVAVVDYGMGNLFSVARACRQVGLEPRITADPDAVVDADAVVLPGVGAFGDAMHALRERGLEAALQESVACGRPLLGVCLGLQLLLSESYEFGVHRGLGIIPGIVERLDPGAGAGLKVPHVGWNQLWRPSPGAWDDTPLAEHAEGVAMYFVHSFTVRPVETAHVVSITRYGGGEFCSTLAAGTVLGCQYHPELSGPQGLAFYRAFAGFLIQPTPSHA